MSGKFVQLEGSCVIWLLEGLMEVSECILLFDLVRKLKRRELVY